MRRLIVIIVMLITWVLLLSQPIIEFETLKYDFGKIKEEAGPHEFDFKFVNTGNESFRLIKVKAGWGCTAPSWSTDEIEPEQIGIITVQYDSNNRPGKFNKSMLVYTNINNEVIRLIIEGYVIPTPGKFRSKIGSLDARTNVLEFGDIFLNTKQNESISIFNPTEDTIYIRQTNEFEYIELKIEPQILEPEQSGEIVIQFSTINSKLGKQISVCDFEITKKEKKIKGYLSIIANIVEDFSLLTDWELANPPIIYTDFQKIDLGKVELNKLITKEIEIENRGEKRDLLVHNIITTNSMYLVSPTRLTIEPGKKKIFQINIKPTTDRNNIASKLTIISNDPEQSIISFSIIGEVIQPDWRYKIYLIRKIVRLNMNM